MEPEETAGNGSMEGHASPEPAMDMDTEMAEPGPSLRPEFLALAAALQDHGSQRVQQMVGIPSFINSIPFAGSNITSIATSDV